MTTVQIVPPSETAKPPHAAPQTVQEDLALVVRTISESVAKLAPSTKLVAGCFYHAFKIRKDLIKRGINVCEKPSVGEYFSRCSTVAKSYEDRAKKAASAADPKKTVPGPVKEFIQYWDKINANNELEFVGAMYIFESLFRANSPIEELAAFAEKHYGSYRDQDEQSLAFIKELIHEFSYTSRERIVAGARHASHFARRLLGELG